VLGLWPSDFTKLNFSRGFAQTPLGELTLLPDFLVSWEGISPPRFSTPVFVSILVRLAGQSTLKQWGLARRMNVYRGHVPHCLSVLWSASPTRIQTNLLTPPSTPLRCLAVDAFGVKHRCLRRLSLSATIKVPQLLNRSCAARRCLRPTFDRLPYIFTHASHFSPHHTAGYSYASRRRL